MPAPPDAGEAEQGFDDAALVGSVLAERYRVVRLAGQGGMGLVYEAEHVHMQKRVAVKLLHAELSADAEVVARFEREALAAARIQHPGVVAAIDFGRLPSGTLYLVLEYVEGQSLSELLKAGPLEPERAVSIALSIALALAAAHEAGIIHRDLKPDNVMLVPGIEDEPQVKVLDFGIAKLVAVEGHEEREGLTRAGVVFGTPEYMSPEQARGGEVDVRSDLYALGMILYEMLAGHSAFSADEAVEVLRAQLISPVPPLPEQLPEPLVRLVYRLLEKEPENRPASALELCDELSHLTVELGHSWPLSHTSAGLRAQKADADASVGPVSMAPRAVSLWVPGLALLLGLAAGAFFMLRKAGEGTSPQRLDAQDPVEQLEVEAREGDRDALGELRRLLELERTHPQPAASPERKAEAEARRSSRYLSLGRGFTVIRHYSAALDAYQKAVEADPHVAEDDELLVDVRLALEQRDAMESGIDFARTSLGAPGADLIFDVWQDARGKPGMTPVVARAQKQIRDKEFRNQATPQLQVALDLERAQACAEYREILPAAVENADQRSLLKLEALRTKRGCGPNKMQDCFVCLRSPEVPLEAAIQAAQARPAPKFLKED
jgi:serine/threonine-protein kinase